METPRYVRERDGRDHEDSHGGRPRTTSRTKLRIGWGLLILSAVFWSLLLVGIAFDPSDVGAVIGGGILFSAIPIAVGYVLVGRGSGERASQQQLGGEPASGESDTPEFATFRWPIALVRRWARERPPLLILAPVVVAVHWLGLLVFFVVGAVVGLVALVLAALTGFVPGDC